MDPVTHTLTGTSLAAVGLRRATPLATATLVLAANAPDVDVVAHLFGTPTALAWRRGITHGIPALILLPFLVTGAIVLWDRHIRLRRMPEAQPVRTRAVLFLAFLGVWTHPALDWLNTYGMRWLMPFDNRWTYGDAVFIIDPWLWLLVGGASFVVFSRTLWARIAWAVLAAAGSALVLASVIPLPAKVLWVLGLAILVLIRARIGPRKRHRQRRAAVARFCGAGAAVYIAAMVALAQAAERDVRNRLAQESIVGVGDVMVSPAPANPLAGVAVAEVSDMYMRGTFRWNRSPRFRPDLPGVFIGDLEPLVEAVQEDPDARNFLKWSRFPFYQVEEVEAGFRVRVGDARYPDDPGTGGLRGVTVYLDPELRLLDPPG